MNKHQYILSICIPTYNRGTVLLRNVRKWLESPCQEFSIVICDNASTDGTLVALSEIKDHRLFVLHNEVNLGSWENGARVLMNGQGKYSMILMDKDSLCVQDIEAIIDELRTSSCAAGRVVPDVNASEGCSTKIYETKLTAPKKRSAWKMQTLRYVHPSGYFFDSRLLRDGHLFPELRKMNIIVRPFSTDFLVLYMLSKGEFLEIRRPLVLLNLPPFEGVERSYTYKEGDDLFFLPEFRFKVFVEYFRLAASLRIGLWQRCMMLKSSLRGLRSLCTRGFEDVLKNDRICQWYGVSEQFRRDRLSRELDDEYMTLLMHVKGLPIFESLAIRFYRTLHALRSGK